MTMTTTTSTAASEGVQDYDDDDSAAAPRTFIHAREFIPNLHDFCIQPDEAALDHLKNVLDFYQNEPYLLEPHLEELSQEPIQAFKLSFSDEHTSLHQSTSTSTPATSHSLQLYATYLYWLSKVVTAKVLIRYFPHSVADFSLLLSHITSSSTFYSYPWEARYILLLWLSLVINIPFSLDKFGDKVYDSLEEHVLKAWLGATGKERDASALFGSKYFNRKDISEERLLQFLEWCEQSLVNSSDDAFLPVGIFQFLNYLLQDATRQSLTSPLRQCLYRLAMLHDAEQKSNLNGMLKSPLLRRLRIKYIGRLATTYLPPAPSVSRSLKNRKSLFGQADETASQCLEVIDAEFEVPEEVEALLGGLINSLSDSDSRVRWTASKAVSRIAAHVPASFADEISEMVIATYAENVQNEDTADEDLTLVSSSAWQGATLCIASMLRQNLLTAEQVQHALPWIQRALIFSQRKGAQKIGSSVRDAACYFCWCLATAESVQGPLTNPRDTARLGETLVVVACLDDETSVRRAASAAFQECTGRMSGIEEGLDVLQLMDAQLVGSKRNAFLRAAPVIAKRHPFYRNSLVKRLWGTLLYNQDRTTRELSAESLKRIIDGNEDDVAIMISEETSRLATVRESRVAHGSLLLLSKLCEECGSPNLKVEAFKALATLPSSLCTGGPVALLLPAVAQLAQVCLVQLPIAAIDFNTLDHKNAWRRFLEVAQRRPESSSHEAAGLLVNANYITDMSINNTCLRTLKSSSSPTSQQCVTAVLGYFDFSKTSACNELLGITIDRLVKVLNPLNAPTCKTVDAKCNVLNSLGRIYLRYVDEPKTDKELIIKMLFDGLEDYTTDQRGEVGSLVRNICLENITSIILQQDQQGRLEPSLIHLLALQLLKQSVEKLDIVREQAGRQLKRLISVRTIVPEEDLQSWRQSTVAIQAVLRLFPTFDHPARLVILSGIVTSTGSPPEVQQSAMEVYLEWAKSLPLQNKEEYSLISLLQELLEIAPDKTLSNRITVPALHTLASMLEDQPVRISVEDSAGGKAVLGNIATHATQIENSSRITSKQSAARRLQQAAASSSDQGSTSSAS